MSLSNGTLTGNVENLGKQKNIFSTNLGVTVDKAIDKAIFDAARFVCYREIPIMEKARASQSQSVADTIFAQRPQ